jgi:hypothetical protein
MVMLPIEPVPFFSSKNRAFWILQLTGWGGAFLLRTVIAVTNGQPLDLLGTIFVSTVTGFSISFVLAVVYRQLINRQAYVTWGTTVLVFVLAVILQATIDAWVQGIYYGGELETTFFQRFIGLSFIPMALLGGWSALYYAINYFLTIEQQADRLERLEAQKTAAQLAMLRYQLNPHFLFNTLNSISTLVLFKETEAANAMLTRLSHFLRHTLILEPGSQVTLAEEIGTLQLYLDIERMRFEERLRTRFEIEDAALAARLPSMLLQPLVENAIKYAVSPLEEGAEISVTAKVIGQKLQVIVADTGPGTEGLDQRDLLDQPGQGNGTTASTGVGLTNTRNRLIQGYGEKATFSTRSPPGGGFQVFIEIPYQRVLDSASEPETASDKAASPPVARKARAASAGAAGSSNPNGEQPSAAPLNPAQQIGSSA